MDEPNWAQILAVIYRSDDVISTPYDLSDLPKDHEFVEKTTLSASEVNDGIDFLQRQELVSVNKVAAQDADSSSATEFSSKKFELTSKGFDVAHERELSLRENAGNYAVTALTTVLVLTSIVQGIITYVSEDLGLVDTAVIGFLIIALAATLGVFWFRLHSAGAVDIDSLIDRQKRMK